MKTKIGAMVLVTAFLVVFAVPWTVLAAGGGGGRGGGRAGGGAGMTGGESIRNQIRVGSQIRTRDVERLRMRDGEGDRDRIREQDRDRDRIHKVSGTGPFLPKEGTGYGAPTIR
ncbi:MAG: hypothetical protein ACM3OG_10895 [Actinomycetota bacterium]